MKSIDNGEVKLYVDNNTNKKFATISSFETVGDLLDTLLKDDAYGISNGRYEEFRNTKISIQLIDIEGQIVTGDANLVVGWCGDKFVITGNVQSVDFIKEDRDE